MHDTDMLLDTLNLMRNSHLTSMLTRVQYDDVASSHAYHLEPESLFQAKWKLADKLCCLMS